MTLDDLDVGPVLDLGRGVWSLSVTDSRQQKHVVDVWGTGAWIETTDGSSPYTWYDCAVDRDIRNTSSHPSLEAAIEAALERIRST